VQRHEDQPRPLVDEGPEDGVKRAVTSRATAAIPIVDEGQSGNLEMPEAAAATTARGAANTSAKGANVFRRPRTRRSAPIETTHKAVRR
jgi:hypothetical protein